MKHLLVEFQDGSFQWIKNTSENDVKKIPGFKRIKSEANGNFHFTTRRWRESSESQFEVSYLDLYSTGSVSVK